MRKVVWITTQFEAFHRWLHAPDDVSFLRDFHRHVFHVRLEVLVSGSDREVEFIQLKHRVDNYIGLHFENKCMERSCEMIAQTLLEEFNAVVVAVSEDGENGATVSRPCSMIARDKVFVGIEAEGPHRGKCTLFVPGCVTPSRLGAVVGGGKLELYEVEHVYYGAGWDHALSYHTLLYLRDSLKLPTTVEGDHLDRFGDIFQKWEGLTAVSVKDAGKLNLCHYTKRIEGSLIIWSGKEGTFVTSIHDPLFDGDFVVED